MRQMPPNVPPPIDQNENPIEKKEEELSAEDTAACSSPDAALADIAK
jgi:hypothetical protein